jgi:hypothetical protein
MRFPLFVVTLTSLVIEVDSQTLRPEWETIDRGGGRSAGGSAVLIGSIGQAAHERMTGVGSDLEGGYIPGLRQFSGSGIFSVIEDNSWNLLSVPLLVKDFRKSSLYPTAVSSAFFYTGSYLALDTLRNGAGYWVKFNAMTPVSYSGTAVTVDTLSVRGGWNMMGPFSGAVRTVDITPVPPLVINTNYYGYSPQGGYSIADTLVPGKGYWLKVSQAGKIVINSTRISPSATQRAKAGSPLAGSPLLGSALVPESETRLGLLTVSDATRQERTVYFSSTTGKFDLERYSLPPLPPGEVLDARYATDRLLENADSGRPKVVGIQVTSAVYPLMIHWKNDAHIKAALYVGSRVVELRGSAWVSVDEPDAGLVLHIDPETNRGVPATYALYQNFPNPFNPATVIRYDLSHASNVTIRIYNILGQEIQTLIDDQQQAGEKSITFNAGSLPSGVYFYRLTAIRTDRSGQPFTQVRKMALVK